MPISSVPSRSHRADSRMRQCSQEKCSRQLELSEKCPRGQADRPGAIVPFRRTVILSTSEGALPYTSQAKVGDRRDGVLNVILERHSSVQSVHCLNFEVISC
jgi:hypothetical protein